MIPSVSVIIPNYNHDNFLSDRLLSVLTQTYTKFECIILDDASTDNSVSVIESFVANDERISFVRSDKNSGSPFVQWNKGVKLARGEFIWIAESDDMADPEFLETMVRQLVTNPDCGMAYCQSFKVNKEGVLSGNWKDWTDDLDENTFKESFKMNGIEYIERYLIYRNTIPNASAVVFKKAVYDEIGGADESLENCSDWLTWLKILLHHNVAFISKPMNFFRFHEDSVIAKARSLRSNIYEMEFDYSLRIKFNNYLLNQDKTTINILKKLNDRFVYHAIGNYGLYNFNNGNKLKGAKLIVRASWYPVKTLNYLKRLLFTKPVRK